MVAKKNQTFEDYKPAILFGGGGILIVLFLIFIIGVPLYNNVVKGQKELKAKKTELGLLETKLENLKKLADKEADLKAKNVKVLAALPADKDVSRLFVQFEDIAKQNGINITSVTENGQTGTSSGSTAPSGTLAPVNYVINGTLNNYGSLKSALAKTETALRVLSVEKVDVAGTNGSFTVTLNVKTFVRGTEK